MSQAKKKTEPRKKKCFSCGGDLPNTSFAPPIRDADGKEICPDCKLVEIYFGALTT